MSARLTVQETADFLRTLDGVLILTHVRPDGDTVGCAAALCRALRALGRTAYLLKNPEITETYTPYAEGLWAPGGLCARGGGIGGHRGAESAAGERGAV